MNLEKITQRILLTSLAVFSFLGHAEDIELYVNHNANLDEKPRVLIVFDTSGSMAFSTSSGNSCGYSGGYILCSDSRLGVAQDAITKLVDGNDDIDFGLMRFNSTNGGYVLAGIGSDISALKTTIAGLPADGGTPLTETLWEAYLYITGQSLFYGEKVDITRRDTSIENANPYTYYERVCSGPWWDRDCYNKPRIGYTYSYISPFDNSEEVKRCDNSVNIIYMTDGDPSAGSDNEQDSNISALHKSYFGSSLSSDDKIAGVYLHKLAKIIHGTDDVEVDLRPTTADIHETGRVYTIGFGSGMSDNGKRLLSETAAEGGGKYLHANTAEQLSEALKNTITQIREVNDTFTAPSIASNNVDQTRSRESIYYAMFYPKTGARWRGNLKKLKVSGDQIIDKDGKSALNEDGLIDKDAKTFWLPSGESADGNSVELGGVNLYLSNSSSVPNEGRKVLTNVNGRMLNFTRYRVVFHYGTIDKAAVDFEADPDEVEDLINWSRGLDIDDEDKDGSTTDSRKDIFGDPLHSKPVTIDYGNDDIRVLIGTNAGYLHMFQDKNDVLSESWAFIPRSLYKIIKPLRDNQADTKVYGVDGPISVFFDDKNSDGVVNGSDRVGAFFGLRRGGNYYYGLDITNPDSPSLLWDQPIVGGTGDFKELGQTWSKPSVTYVNLDGYKDRPVLIFGAGYDGTIEEIQRDELMINVVYAVFILYQCWSVYRFGYKGLVPILVKSRN